MRIQLSDHFSYKRLLRFVLPSIIMIIFTAIYGIMDGLFVSNFAGKTPFAAINLVLPLIMGLASIGFMVGTGGSALIAKTLGEGDKQKANQIFSMLVYTVIIIGIVLTVIGLLVVRPVMIAIGATGELLENCVLYGGIMLSLQTAFMLQYLFQCIFPVAEKPKLGLAITVISGVIDILLNALFIIVLGWGIVGAAVSTVIGQAIGGFVPIIYFAKHNDSLLRLGRPAFHFKTIIKVFSNGSSELMSTLSSSIIGVLYNLQLIRIAGEDGVAAYGVIMYVVYIFHAIFIGYSMGGAPIIGYHFGAKNHPELKNLFRKSMTIVAISSVMLTLLAVGLAGPIAKIYVGYDAILFEMSRNALRLYALSFLVCGFNIFGSAFFTALNDGRVSATISFARTLLFQTLTILLLPMLMGADGIWLSISVAELLALFMTVFFFIKKNKQYHYI